MVVVIHEHPLKSAQAPTLETGRPNPGSGGTLPAEPYGSSIEHILAELERIDLLIQIQIRRARQLHQDDEFQGLYISEQEVDALLARPIGVPRWALASSAGEENDGAALDRSRTQINARVDASIQHGILLRLVTLASSFNLRSFDIDVVLICLAAELDLRYERLYAYLQDDVTRKRPRVDLVLNLLSSSFLEKLDARERFGSMSPLVRHQLISVSEYAAPPKTTLLNRYLKLDERIVDYLLGKDEIDFRLARQVSLVHPTHTLSDL